MEYTIFTTETSPLVTKENHRVVTVQQRQPTRYFHVIVDCELISELLETIPAIVKPIVDASLMNAAKDIFSDFLKGYAVGVTPSTIDSGYFALNALIDRATNAGIQWLSKEEVTEQWKQSVTYNAWIASPKFKTVPQFAKAVNYYSDLILKLSGKTSSYKDSDLDLILAKLNEDDMTTPLGGFILRRVEALKAKPAQADINAADLL